MTLTPTRLEAATWPDLATVPTGPRAAVSAKVARQLFISAVRRLPVTVVLVTGSTTGDPSDGHTAAYGRGGPVMTVHRPDEFFARVGRQGLIGFGESYLTGAWDAEDLSGFLTVLAAEIQHLVPDALQRLRAVVVPRTPRRHRNTQRNTRGNIAHHYDLSNDLFQLFLDPGLSYSSALFPTGSDGGIDGGIDGQADLREAQTRKIERLLDQADVGEGTRVLEIGSGWGELAIHAARRGARVHTITLSSEQKALADERIAAAGLSHLVEVELCDYREVTGSYDAVLSVEMIEAVGHQYWSTYFETIDRVLAPGGKVAIQAITMPHDRMLATRNTYTWINKYIFPGGFLPSVEVIDQITRRRTGLRITDRLSMGAHYAETLRRWDDAFLAASEQVRALGFDETFRRMWHFYLEYSRAGFASGYIDVNQLTFARPEDL
ncbi:SAM-dependent methyltransferase [Nocardioides ungokensis]|uniref:SAM-dependent methyltransferase n=1 Tax=Nocardioides ungokensis TaxID=1643322 RepID=UPI0015DD7EB8|nr:cyclopropane-fatty-acyl-phospholipid synthase family protein [Nocardioides ungokensis]